MSTPRASVIVPMYNAAATVAGTLRSLQEQSLREWEAIVVDDGSTDGSASIVRTVFGNDRRVRLIQQPNRGVSAARNAGVREARGDYLYWLDPDDVCCEGALAALVAAAETNGFGAAVGNHDVVSPAGDVLHESRLKPRVLGLSELLDGCSTRCGSHVVRRDLVTGPDGELIAWDETRSLWEDRDYWMRLAENGVRWGVLDRVVTLYVIQPIGETREASLSKRAHEMLRSGGEVLRALFERHRGEAGFETERLAGLIESLALSSVSRAAVIAGDGEGAARELSRVTTRTDWSDEALADAARFAVIYGLGVQPSMTLDRAPWLRGLDSLWARLGRDEVSRARCWEVFRRAVVSAEQIAVRALDRIEDSGGVRGVVVVGFGHQGRAVVREAQRRGLAVRVRDDAGVPGGFDAEPMDAPVEAGWGVLVTPLSEGGLRERFAPLGAVFGVDVRESIVRGEPSVMPQHV